MKLLLDQDVYFLTGKFLKESGHDVIRAADVRLSRATDEDILNWCYLLENFTYHS
jgi:predicted nuclease of predicted toxin-antitoxin system